MNREYRNYIFVALGSSIIILIILLDLLSTVNWLLLRYNNLIRYINRVDGSYLSEIELFYFGNGLKNLNLLTDIILYSIVLIVIVMVVLVFYFSTDHFKKDNCCECGKMYPIYIKIKKSV